MTYDIIVKREGCMEQKNYKDLLAFQILQKYGSQEIKEKTTAILKEYENALKNGDAKYWDFRTTEFDEENPNKFLLNIWSYNSPKYFMQLEIMEDFDFSNPLYKNTLTGKTYEIVKYFEQKEKSFSFNPDTITLEVERCEDVNNPKITTKKGSCFSGMKVVSSCQYNEDADQM